MLSCASPTENGEMGSLLRGVGGSTAWISIIWRKLSGGVGIKEEIERLSALEEGVAWPSPWLCLLSRPYSSHLRRSSSSSRSLTNFPAPGSKIPYYSFILNTNGKGSRNSR